MCTVLCASAQFVADIFPKSGLFFHCGFPTVLCIDEGENEENIVGRKREIGGRGKARSNMVEVPPSAWSINN